VEQGTICSGFDFIDDVGLEIDKESAGDMLARPGLGEEGREAAIIVRWRIRFETTVRLQDGSIDIRAGNATLTLRPCSTV
jgi:hypothetical protein